EIDGLATKIINFFNNDGYLDAIVSGTGLSESQLQQANFFNTNGASSTAASLARHDLNMAKSYISEIAPVLAYNAAYQYMSDMLTAADTGARIEISNDNPAAPYFQKCQELIADARKRLANSYQAAATRYGGASKIVELKMKYMDALPLQRFEQDQSPLSAQ
ncbi:TPA: conjugal transfer protein, partial [Klebsiella pneumoniae]|nr:conjugal transfer protein [Klebsiella pneumoniae]